MTSKPLKPEKKSNRGGKRAGSGRKPKGFHQLRKDIIAAFENGVVEFLPRALENLMILANGGFQRVDEKWEPADPAPDGTPRPMVLVERKVSTAEPDRAANQYMIDRILGRPRQSVEITDADDGKPRRIVIPSADDRPEPDTQSGREDQAGA